MFDLPEAKRVRRDELGDESDRSTDVDGEEDEALRARLEAQMAQSLGLIDIAPASVSQKKTVQPARKRAATPPSSESDDDESDAVMEDKTGKDDDEESKEEYEFSLFGGGAAPTKVVLEDDTKTKGPGTLETKRPRTFYLSGKLSEDDKARYQLAAVSGDEILERSKQRWWGMEYPWRVTHISVKSVKDPNGKLLRQTEEGDPKKKRRPGKKRRVAVRTKERAKKKEEEERERVKKEEAEAAEKKAGEKEEHLKEKRKRMNRLKKIRKRAKNKEAKAAAGAGGEADGEDSGGDSDE